MTHDEYLLKFSGKVNGSQQDRAEKALDLALDIRKFEIELYWKRATYFWAFIGAALTGYILVYRMGDQAPNAWLSLMFSSLGLMFSIAWYLVNRGSKFWQNNWERHVDLLEDQVLGPLYKTMGETVAERNPLTAPAQYSVSKINQMLSVFVIFIWVILFVDSLLPVSTNLRIDYIKVFLALLTASGVWCLFAYGRSSGIKKTRTTLEVRELLVEPAQSRKLRVFET